MKERPIIFNTDMVRAILEGRKTMTRRLIEPQPCDWVERIEIDSLSSKYRARLIGEEMGIKCCAFSFPGQPEIKLLYQPGDRLRIKGTDIIIEITEVRVERVQEISEEDAIKEGCQTVPIIKPEEKFAALWHSIYAEKGFGWDKNPWVWVISFKVVKG